MTLSDLLTHLSQHDPEAALRFTADGVQVRGGYHVTEFQIAEIRSMTCGGTQDAWSEARLQIMDGHGLSAAMSVAKFLQISGRVQARFPEMMDLPLKVEFAPDNNGLRVYQPAAPVQENGQITVPLSSSRATCKAQPAITSCCGTGEACCAA